MNIIAQSFGLINMAYKERRRIVKVKKTKLLINILQLFYDEGLIRGYTLSDDLKNIFVFLKYYEMKPLILGFKLISFNRYYFNISAYNIGKYFSNNGFFIISTDKYGLIFTNRLIRKNLLLSKKVGGIILFQIYL